MVIAVLLFQVPVPRPDANFIYSPTNLHSELLYADEWIEMKESFLDFSAYLRTSASGADNTVEYLFPPGRETNA
jgi:hypothetical protein